MTYQIIARPDGLWHLSLPQSQPLAKTELGCNTMCGVWAEMKHGYERGRPTCPTCLRSVLEYETKMTQPWADWTTEDVVQEVSGVPHFGVGSRRRRRGG